MKQAKYEICLEDCTTKRIGTDLKKEHILVGDIVNWYKLLKKEVPGEKNRLTLLAYAWYNNKYWYPDGRWPYGMKRKQHNTQENKNVE